MTEVDLGICHLLSDLPEDYQNREPHSDLPREVCYSDLPLHRQLAHNS